MSNDNYIEVLIDLLEIGGVPKFIGRYNGPESIARRLHGSLESIDVGTLFI